MKATWRRVALWVGTVAGIGIILLMLFLYEPSAVLQPLLHSEPELLAVVAALLGAVQFLNAATPAVLLGSSELEPTTWWGRTRVFLATQPLALIAPGRLSDFGVLPLLRRHYPTGAVASVIVLDRLITVFFLLLLTPLALHFVWPARSSVGLYAAVAASLILVSMLPFVLLNRRLRDLVNRTLLRLWPNLLRGFGAQLEFLLHTSRTRLLVNFGLTAVKTIVSGAVIALLAANVGLSVGLIMGCWIAVLTQLATSIPISIQGIGVAEASLVLLLSVNGYSEALALAMGVVARLLFLPVYAIIYLGVTVPLMSERLRSAER